MESLGEGKERKMGTRKTVRNQAWDEDATPTSHLVTH